MNPYILADKEAHVDLNLLHLFPSEKDRDGTYVNNVNFVYFEKKFNYTSWSTLTAQILCASLARYMYMDGILLLHAYTCTLVLFCLFETVRKLAKFQCYLRVSQIVSPMLFGTAWLCVTTNHHFGLCGTIW